MQVVGQFRGWFGVWLGVRVWLGQVFVEGPGSEKGGLAMAGLVVD